MRLLEKAIS